MPTKPQPRTLNAKTPDILNAIRNRASANYQQFVPKATDTNVREIGNVIMGNPTFQNEFLSGLVNRIGLVVITSKLYENPWNMFKKGILEFGETIEEIFVNIAKAHPYDIDKSETEVFKREIPDVMSVFHILNYKTFYKQTIQQEQLRQAFLSMDGVTDLIARIVDAMYTAANYDEFMVMKYLIAKHILKGDFYPVTIPATTADNAKQIVADIKQVSNELEFMSDNYNMASVPTYTKKENQYLIVNSKLDAIMDVEVLASAFNMDKAQFMGHRVLVDSFGKMDRKRLNELFVNSPEYTEITDEEIEALEAIPAVLIDREWFMMYDNMNQFTEQYNGQGLYWNYWYHQWKTVSASPFANAVALIPGEPAVTGITISPSTATVGPGGQVALKADVTAENFAPTAVTWAVDDTKATVNFNGVVTVKSDVAPDETITVTATSVYDDTKTASATITVA